MMTYKYIRLLLATVLGLAVVLAVAVGPGVAANLLTNGNFELFQSYNGANWRGYPEKYGQGWSLKVISEDGLHFMDSDTFGQFIAGVYGQPYLNYHIEGNYSQVAASRRAFHYVFSQTVPVSAGQDYAFGGKIVSFWKGPDNEIDHTKILKRIGIDPTGGADYAAASVQWTGWDGTDNAWISPALAQTAQSGQMTVFIEINNTGGDVGPAYLNTVFIDNFKLELAPVASLNLPAQTPPGPVNVSWSATIPDPSFWSLWGYDVEYKDSVSGVWQTVQTHDDPANGASTSFTLNAQAGRTYTVRVRPWQERAPSGDPATTALPGMWQEKSMVVGEAVAGRVMNHAGLGLSGVTVSVSGTATTTTSTSGGSYVLPTGGTGTFRIQAVGTGGLVAPPPATVTVTAGNTAALDITLRPTGSAQALTNNDFETDLSGWNVSGTADVSTAEQHSGNSSLRLAGGAVVSQTGVVTGMARPLLSFWYKTDPAAGLSVVILGSTGPVQTYTLPAATSWTHVTLESGLGDSYTGSVGAQLGHTGTGKAFIDEVSLAAGPWKTFLPVILAGN
ncbi:MAG: fibronectin type III domain-containing protein [Chloroflexi bacterium]|nr:MAG: fibronectin type III domain-containing protein [Chloroflexota bacterium]